MHQSLEPGRQDPEHTPWSMGGGGWPIRPELVEATRVRLATAAKAISATGSYFAMVDPVKESLSKMVDQTSVKESSTMQRLLAFIKVNHNIVEAQPCGMKHFGLCEQRDIAILAKSFALAKLMNAYTAKAIPKNREGRVCFMFRSTGYVLFAFQGKVKRRPQWQGYVFHAIEGKNHVQMATDPHRCPLMPVYRVQDCQMPLVLKIHQYTEASLGGYMGCCTVYGLARTMFTLDNVSWDVVTVAAKCLNTERCETTGEGIERVGVIREGEILQEFQPHDDLNSAVAMLKRVSATPSTNHPASGASGSDGGGGGGATTAPCPIPEGYGNHGIQQPQVISPQAANDLVTKLMSAYSELFIGSNDYEEELLDQLRQELQHDDEIEDAIFCAKTSKSKAPTTKLGNTYHSNAARKKTATFTAPDIEPPAKFLAMESTFASVTQLLV